MTRALNRKLVSLGAALALGASLMAAPAAEESQVRVTVDYQNPSKFTDIEMGAITTDKDRAYLLSKISNVFKSEAQHVLPEGYALTVSVRDIDLAGDQEPFASPNHDIRIMRDIYAPRIEFAYSVRDARNEVVTEGVADLRDPAYNWDTRAALESDRDAVHIRHMIKDWFRDNAKKLFQDS